jgi:DNA-binding winged helix-turn-helix (wHTH) protein/predicted ATPase
MLMTTDSMSITFPPFRMEVLTGTLWRGKQQQRLRSQAAMVLQYLADRPGQVVSNQELLTALWPKTTVSEGILKTYVWEIRRALGDQLHKPRFIETIPRRGYRFVGKVVSSQQSVVSRKEINQEAKGKKQKAEIGTGFLAPSTQHLAPLLIGREAELAQLHRWLEKALSGDRQVVFVSGEPGIGKTTLIEAFLQSLESRVRRQKKVVSSLQSVVSREDKRQKAKASAAQSLALSSQSWSSLNPKSQILTPSVWVAWGQCIEHYGPSEAYMPVLTALGRLCRESDEKQLLKLLHRYAPTWLVQLPALLSPPLRQRLEQDTGGATRGRMLREIAEALEAITATRTLVLWIDDLHWSDTSTLDLLSFLASRHELARLMIIGTYRPIDILGNGHPLRAIVQELTAHKQCRELQVGSLNEEDIREYLEGRFAAGARHSMPLGRLAHAIHQRTEGNPLFMVNAVEYLLAQGAISQAEEPSDLQPAIDAVQTAVPPNIQQMIERQLERVSAADQRILEVASVVGAEFSAAAVAAGAATPTEEVEERCAEFTRRALFLRATGTAEWPNGTVATRYEFLHALYQHVLYERIPSGKRIGLHQRIGERLEQSYGTQTREIAAALAMHFEHGRDFSRATHYLRQAGENATRRSAHNEAVSLFTKGLELLSLLPHNDERTQQEIRLHLALGLPLTTLKGYASPEVEYTYTRARQLCLQMEDTRYLFPAVLGLGGVRQNQAEFGKARVLAQQLLRLARTEGDPARLLWAHVLSGQISYLIGEFSLAHKDFVQGIALYDARKHSPQASDVVQDPGVHCRCYLAEILWIQGYADQARQLSHQALHLARQLAHSHSKAVALTSAVLLHNWLGEQPAAQDLAEELIALTDQQGFPFWLAVGTIRRGWTLVAQGQEEQGLAQMRQGVAIFYTTGAKFALPGFFCDLAEAHERAGQVEEGLALVTEALKRIAETGEHLSEAELYRLRGELTLQSHASLGQVSDKSRTSLGQVKGKFKASQNKSIVTDPRPLTPDPRGEAEACFRKAITIARQQQAKSLELRAVMSLVRLRQQQATKHQGTSHEQRARAALAAAHRMLSDVYHWFTEGFATADLQEAKALLDQLEKSSGTMGSTGKH